jgi:hypothetical protein
MSMSEVVKTALRVAGKRRLLLPAPKFVMRAAAALLQFAPGRPLTPDAVDFICQDAIADNGDVEHRLGIRLTPLAEGLATYLGKHER